MGKQIRFIIFILLLPAVLLFLQAGCKSADAGVKSNEKTLIEMEELPEIAAAREKILFGSPVSLNEGYAVLEESPAGNSAPGRELLYIADMFMEILYPEVQFEGNITVEPFGSDYPDLFADVRAGEFSSLVKNFNSPLQLNAVTCTVLFTDDPELLVLCGAAAQAAAGGESESVVPYYMQGIIEKKMGNPEDAVYYFEKALALDGSVYPARWEAVQILKQIGDAANRNFHLEKLYSDFPENTQYGIELADSYFALNEGEKGMQIVDSLDVEPENPLYLNYLLVRSRGEELVGNLEEAVAVIEQAREGFPENIAVLNRYGSLLIETGNRAKGFALLEIALDLGLEDQRAEKLLLQYYAEQNNWREAVRFADSLFDVLTEPIFLSYAVNTYLESGEIEKALPLAEKMAASGGGDADLLQLYARTLLASEDREKAAEILREALTRAGSRKTRSTIYFLLSNAAVENGTKIEMLQNALFENMENIEALLDISRIYRRLGDTGKALRYIRQASVIAPENREVEDLLKQLEAETDG